MCSRRDEVQVVQGQCKGQQIGRGVQKYRQKHESPLNGGRRKGQVGVHTYPSRMVVTRLKLDPDCKQNKKNKNPAAESQVQPNRKGKGQIQGRKYSKDAGVEDFHIQLIFLCAFQLHKSNIFFVCSSCHRHFFKILFVLMCCLYEMLLYEYTTLLCTLTYGHAYSLKVRQECEMKVSYKGSGYSSSVWLFPLNKDLKTDMQCMPVMLVHGRQRLEDHFKFEASMVYIGSMLPTTQ